MGDYAGWLGVSGVTIWVCEEEEEEEGGKAAMRLCSCWRKKKGGRDIYVGDEEACSRHLIDV
jgi:hypothetical protein